jgi:uncharacterized protein
VPAGTAMRLDVRFEAVTEGVLVTGSATAPVTGECARCLAPVTATVTAGFRELYLYRGGGRGEDAEQDEEERYLDGDLLDLEQALRDAVVLALPMSPWCRDDCPGLCVECGVPLAEAGSGHGHGERPDPRWAMLKQFDTEGRTGATDLQEG